MLEKLKVAGFIVAGIVHLLPITGLLGAEKLSKLYGITVNDGNLQILMQHRAVLFALLGCFLTLAAFRSEYQLVALIAGTISAAAFIALASFTGEFNDEIRRIVIADWVALTSLTIAGLCMLFGANGN